MATSVNPLGHLVNLGDLYLPKLYTNLAVGVLDTAIMTAGSKIPAADQPTVEAGLAALHGINQEFQNLQDGNQALPDLVHQVATGVGNLVTILSPFIPALATSGWIIRIALGSLDAITQSLATMPAPPAPEVHSGGVDQPAQAS